MVFMNANRLFAHKFFLKLLFVFCISSQAWLKSEIVFGDLVLIKNVATGRYLSSGEKSFNNGELDLLEDGDRRHKLVWLTSKADYGCGWIVKGAHSDDLRWNVTLGEKLKKNQKIRFENIDNHCNLSVTRKSRNVIAVKRINLPLGIGVDEDNLKIKFAVKTDDEQKEFDLKANEEFSLIFTETDPEVHLFVDPKDGLLKVKEEKDLTEDEKTHGLWACELVQKNFAQNDDKKLDESIKSLRSSNEWSEVTGSLVSKLFIWQDEAESKFLISTIDLADGYAYLSNTDNNNAINEKLPDRFASIYLENEQILFGTNKEKRIKKIELKDLAVEKTFDLPQKGELIFSSKAEDLYRLESVGWDLFKSEKVAPEFTWQKEPILNNVVCGAQGADGTLWWIDLDGNISKKLGDKLQSVFSHTVFNNPKFIKISVAGTWDKNYVAILRSDGRVFFSKDNGAFFSPGLNQALDVSIGRAGRVGLIVRRANWVNGPIFKSKFADLEKWYKDNNKQEKNDFKDPAAFLDYYAYNFELVKHGAAQLCQLVVHFQADSEVITKELKNHDPARAFFNEKLRPALKTIELDNAAKLALSTIESELFLQAAAQDELANIAELTEKNLKLSATLESEKTAAKIALDTEVNKRVALEDKLKLIGQEFEAVLFRLDELEHENKDLKVQLENSKKEKELVTPKTGTVDQKAAIEKDKLENPDDQPIKSEKTEAE